ncbi:hypothetical protein SAMN04487910_1392 [Aquimarina amphilecti]|uniref:Uncharacterized protein n=1 Tax=Aquimarina amphilecti TaxID=1038014 RepID=A0A1H7KPI5_AQUAM|nr:MULTISPECIES: hypothetical protein [Aquimarina]MBQ4801724.1 hypothetical protein [Aquimarina sp. MMG015]SEK88699.1 hypothetical protein SAMN04487910_1392 [Aquimarina amphilecti]
MKNLKNQTTTLTSQEIKTITGGNHNPSVIDDGNGGGCTGPVIIIIKPTTGPTFPDPDTIFG